MESMNDLAVTISTIYRVHAVLITFVSVIGSMRVCVIYESNSDNHALKVDRERSS